jgi:hypothetical protein
MHGGEMIFKGRLGIVGFPTIRTNYRVTMVIDFDEVLDEHARLEFPITHITLYIICKEKQNKNLNTSKQKNK